QSTLGGSTTKIEGNGGDDVFVVTSNAPGTTGNLDGVVGTLTVEAGAGAANRLIVSDFGGAANPAAIVTNNQISGLSPADIFYAATGGAFTDGAANDGIFIRGSDTGADVFDVRSTLGASTTKVEGNGGDDTFVLGFAQDLGGVIGTLTVDAGAGAMNRLIADDSAAGAPLNVLLTSSRITGLSPATIFYAATGGSFNDAAGTSGVVINGSAAFGDVFNVQSTLAGSSTDVRGGGGDDQFFIQGDGLGGSSIFRGEAGIDLFVVNAGVGITGTRVALSGGADGGIAAFHGRAGDDVLTL